MNSTIKSLLAGTLEMPLSNCTLRQCETGEPIVYEGPGLLMQGADKSLSLRVFAPAVGLVEGYRRELSDPLMPGKLVPGSRYYDFEGYDPHGTLWTATRLSLGVDHGSGTYIRARPRFIEKREDLSVTHKLAHVQAFLKEQIELPWHVVTTKGELSWSVDRFEGASSDCEWEIKKSEIGVWVSFKCQGSLVESRFEHFLRALSILTGRLLRPTYLTLFEGSQQLTRIANRFHDVNTEKLLAPISNDRDFSGDAHLFLDRFMSKAREVEAPLEGLCDLAYRYWHRILSARESDIENSSLVLSVAVEGLTKKVVLTRSDVDADFVKEVEMAKPLIKSAGLGPRALSCVLSSLGNATTPKVQDALQRLARDGLISADHLGAWKQLRHAAAHGAVLDVEDEALQEHLDRFHLCIDLFYRLVFILIGYEGRHTDFGSNGWPSRTFGANDVSAASGRDRLDSPARTLADDVSGIKS